MEWPRVTETVAVSAHRQVELARWPGAAAPAVEAHDPPAVDPAPQAQAESVPQDDAA